jgi:hypothetical protein
MGDIERRIQDLERLVQPPEDEDAQLRRAMMAEIIDEISSLKASRARGVYRGGTPPTPIQPTDPAGEHLGYPYTYGEHTEFAIKRVVERLDFSEEESEEIVTHWVGVFRELGRELGVDRWDEVDAEGPPEPTPPWH